MLVYCSTSGFFLYLIYKFREIKEEQKLEMILESTGSTPHSPLPFYK